jgi:hypothetical protein
MNGLLKATAVIALILILGVHCDAQVATPTPTLATTPTATATATATSTTTATATVTVTPSSTGCAQITEKDIHCSANGDYSYTIIVTNNSTDTFSQVLLTPAPGTTSTLSPQLTNLSSPLQTGQSTSITTTIGNVTPGNNVCFFASLMSDKAQCCTIQVCPTLPACGGFTPTPSPTATATATTTPTPSASPSDCWCCVDMPGGMGVANTTKENCTQHGVGPQGAECFPTQAAAVDYCYPVWCCITAPDGSVSVIKTTEADCAARHGGLHVDAYPTKEFAIAACQEPPGTWCCAPVVDSHGRPIHEAFAANAQQCAAQGGQLFNTEAEALANCNLCWCCPQPGNGEYFLMDSTECKSSNYGAQCFSNKADAMACAARTSPTPNPAQKRGHRR